MSSSLLWIMLVVAFVVAGVCFGQARRKGFRRGKTSEQGTHFWFMGIHQGNNLVMDTGTYTPKRGETRFDACQAIYDHMCTRNPKIAGGVILAFDIQPNKL